MNPNTGEIKEFTREESERGVPQKSGFDIPLNAAEAETLQELSEPERVVVMQNWKDKEKHMKFNNNIERSKVKFAFLEGCVVGRLGL